MITIVQNKLEFENLVEPWNALAARYNSPLVRHEWFAACIDAFCPPDQLSIVVLGDEQKISGVAPLSMAQSEGGMRMEILGASVLCEPGGLLSEDDDAIRDLLNAMVMMEKPFTLARLAAESPEVQTLEALAKSKKFVLVTRQSSSPWIPIDKPWSEFEKGISAHRRSTLRRARKRADQAGHFEIEFRSPQPTELDPLLEEFFAVEAAGWKGRNGSAIGLVPQTRRFFTSYANAAARLGMLRLGQARLNNRVIAVLMAVEYANKFWVLKIGYDEAWARCSPGVLLMHESVRWAFDHRLEAYEFLGQDESWIHVWPTEIHQYRSEYIYPLSMNGVLRFGKDISKSLRQKANKWVENQGTIWIRKLRGLPLKNEPQDASR